ncbi:hypothetical protein ABZ990_21670 [Streptomyces sp. NPDC046203]|uniref:hypothetical protein n=1 Tax=Streptomyces sp. NPDC046203 TaxID=3154602 RepID=UPI0033BFCFCB
MSFDEEWASAREAARERIAMRLNQTDPSRGGASDADLKVRQDHLGAIGHAAYELHGRLARDGRHASATTEEAGGDLTDNGFLTGIAMNTVQRTWSSQLRTLVDACAHISNHLDYSAALHAQDDRDIRTSISRSKIDEYLK